MTGLGDDLQQAFAKALRSPISASIRAFDILDNDDGEIGILTPIGTPKGDNNPKNGVFQLDDHQEDQDDSDNEDFDRFQDRGLREQLFIIQKKKNKKS